MGCLISSRAKTDHKLDGGGGTGMGGGTVICVEGIEKTA